MFKLQEEIKMICPHCNKEIEIPENNERGKQQKLGMLKKSAEGKHMSRAPFGYERDLKSHELIPAQNSQEVEEIFEEFLEKDINLSTLAEKHGLSINGLKKILRNFAYIGKVKFDGQIHNANHKPIVSPILFNKVQDKLERMKRKKKNLNDVEHPQ